MPDDTAVAVVHGLRSRFEFVRAVRRARRISKAMRRYGVDPGLLQETGHMFQRGRRGRPH